MTPKKKAEELVEKYDSTLTYLESKSKVKQCALIAVDELIEVASDYCDYDETITKKYWEKVKTEIEKL
jgi:hypothetical protein